MQVDDELNIDENTERRTRKKRNVLDTDFDCSCGKQYYDLGHLNHHISYMTMKEMTIHLWQEVDQLWYCGVSPVNRLPRTAGVEL